MAKKKRKYIRRKPLRHDTVPLSSVFMGLLPIVLMAATVGGYIIYQYAGITTIPEMPELSGLPATPTLPSFSSPVAMPSLPAFPDFSLPEIHWPQLSFPEITISFTEVGKSLAMGGAGVIGFVMGTAEYTVTVVSTAWSTFTFLMVSLTQWILFEIGRGLVNTRDGIEMMHRSIIIYFQTLGWTIADFISFLDIPGKSRATVDAIFWPVQFLNPTPLINGVSERVNETNKAFSQLLAPLHALVNHIWGLFVEAWEPISESMKEIFSFFSQSS